MLKFSIITVVKNSEDTIYRCLSSILSQSYPNIEIIVVDGFSTDRTLEVIQRIKNENLKVYSGEDKGIYDALNKGIALSTGEVIGLLHSDDYLTNDFVIQDIASNFEVNKMPILIGKLAYFKPADKNKTVREYFPAQFKKWMFRFGIAPPHPAFYVKRELFEKYGNYRIDLEIAGDFDLMLRFLYIHKVPYKCINQNWVMMSTGGKSTSGWKSIIKNNKDIIKVCKNHQLKTNFLLIYSKYFLKLFGMR